MITMLTDHMACAFFDKNEIMRSIGRFAFPLYAFMITEQYKKLPAVVMEVKECFRIYHETENEKTRLIS